MAALLIHVVQVAVAGVGGDDDGLSASRAGLVALTGAGVFFEGSDECVEVGYDVLFLGLDGGVGMHFAEVVADDGHLFGHCFERIAGSRRGTGLHAG